MRLIVSLTLAFCFGSAFAVSGSLHKCQTKTGKVYYTDKACSSKNERDKPLLDKDGKAIPQEPAPPPKKYKK